MSAEAIPRNDSNDQANAYIHGSVIRNHVPFEATREEKKMKGNVRRRGGISQEIRYSKLVSARVRLSYFLSVNDSFHPNYVRRNVFTLPVLLPSFLPSFPPVIYFSRMEAKRGRKKSGGKVVSTLVRAGR